MANLGLQSVISQLRTERTHLTQQLAQVDAALSALGSLSGNSARVTRSAPTTKRVMSEEARRKISLAQKARWAKAGTATKAVATTTTKRVMSAAARKKIAAAQKARWAKVKAKKAA